MEKTIVYRLFGIPVWSITTRVSVTEEDEVYRRLSERFIAEMQDSLNRARRGGP